MVTQTREPIQITAGDTISFTKSLADYLASEGWSLKYTLRGGAEAIEFTSTASGDDHVLLVAAATTALWLPAEYTLTGLAEKGGERHVIYMATLPVLANVESDDAQQATTHAQRMLAKLEAVLEGKAGDDILDSEIEGTVIRRMPFDQIYKLRAKYKREREAEVVRENIRNGKPSGRRIRSQINVMFPAGGGSSEPRFTQ